MDLPHYICKQKSDDGKWHVLLWDSNLVENRVFAMGMAAVCFEFQILSKSVYSLSNRIHRCDVLMKLNHKETQTLMFHFHELDSDLHYKSAKKKPLGFRFQVALNMVLPQVLHVSGRRVMFNVQSLCTAMKVSQKVCHLFSPRLPPHLLPTGVCLCSQSARVYRPSSDEETRFTHYPSP